MNYIGKTLALGFAQIAQSEEVKELIVAGVKLSTEIIQSLDKILKENYIDSPLTADTTITDNISPVYSDKLITAFISQLIVLSIENVGQAMGANMRSDLIGEYTKIMAKLGKFSSAANKLAIKNRWLEKPPQTMNREKIIKKN